MIEGPLTCLAMHPISPESAPNHLRNMQSFAKKFKYVPHGYVEKISVRVNGQKGAYWSNRLSMGFTYRLPDASANTM
jgi:hypothetical protein